MFLDSVTGGLAATYAYDGNGNMTNDNTKGEFIYDYRNMPIKVVTNDTVIEYAYDAAGQRIRKTLKNGGNTLGETIYVRGVNGNIVAEYRNGQIDHFNIYGNGLIGKLVPANRVVTINNQSLSGTQSIQASDSIIVTGESSIDGEITMEAGAQSGVTDKRYYYLSDHLGSVRVTLTEAGVVDSWSDYFPFGKESRSSSSSNKPREQFTGKERDLESGLDYFGARYYDAEIGRWTSVDPVLSRNATEFVMEHGLFSLSPYQYVRDNPTSRIDPDGMTDWGALFKSNLKLSLSVASVVEGFKVMVAAGGTEGATGGLSSGASLPAFFGGLALFAGGWAGIGESAKNISIAWQTPDGMDAQDFSIIKETIAGLGGNEITQEAIQTIVDAAALKGSSELGEKGLLHLVQVLEAAGSTSEDIESFMKILTPSKTSETKNANPEKDVE